MAQKIRGFTQILDGSIFDAQISASAAIALSKLAEAVIQADGGQAFTADQPMGSNRLTGLANGTQGTDAINLNQLNAALAGIVDLGVVRMATTQDLTSESFGTGGVTYDNGTAGIGATLTQDVPANGIFAGTDSVSAVQDDEILVKNQTTSYENGVYVITSVGDGVSVPWVLTRKTTADEPAELKDGARVSVAQGTSYSDQRFVQIDSITTVGANTMTWLQSSGAGQISAGDGLTKDGNTIDVVSNNAGILANADNIELRVDATAATISIGGAGIQVADSTAGNILIGQGGGTDTAFQAITGDISLSSAGVVQISAGVIVDADVSASAAIALSKLAAGADAQIIVANVSGVPSYVAMSGDATIANTGALTLASNVLKEADIVTQEIPGGTPSGTDGTDGLTAFTLANTPIAGTEKIFVNGVRMERTGQYTISGLNITFVSPFIPIAGDSLIADYWK